MNVHSQEYYVKHFKNEKDPIKKQELIDLAKKAPSLEDKRKANLQRLAKRYQEDKEFRERIKKNSNANREAKKLCKEKANYTCFMCGATIADHSIDAHHIVPIDDGGTDDQSNLVCLCRSCHKLVHSNEVYKQNLIKLL